MGIEKYNELRLLTLQFFEDDTDKNAIWWDTENPHLGNLRPVDFYLLGRLEKLEKFIKSQLQGNIP